MGVSRAGDGNVLQAELCPRHVTVDFLNYGSISLRLRITDGALVIHTHLHHPRSTLQVILLFVHQAAVPGVNCLTSTVADFAVDCQRLFVVPNCPARYAIPFHRFGVDAAQRLDTAAGAGGVATQGRRFNPCWDKARPMPAIPFMVWKLTHEFNLEC